MKRNRMRGVLLAAAIFPTVGHQFTEAATTYFWNNSLGGSGNWDTSTQDWSTTAAGPNNYTWTNNGLEIGSFGGTSGVVTLTSGGVTANSLIFTTGGYTLTGGPLTLAGTGGSISFSGAGTIASQIKGTVGLTKTGSGTLTLTGTNTYSGTTSVSGSYVIGLADASGQPFGSGPMTLAGAGLRLNGINSNTTTTVGNFTVNALSTTFPGASNLIIDNTAGSGGGFTTTLAGGNLARGSTGTVLGIDPVTGGLGTSEVITLTNGSSSLINGILPVWVATQTSSSNTTVDFLTYGANGVTAANYSSTDLTTSTNTSTVNQTSSPTISGDVSAYALKTNQSIDLQGHTLSLGNGSGQSGLILNSGGQVTDGNVTFGSTEGIVYVQGNGTISSSGSTVTADGLTINGSGASTSLMIGGNYVNTSGSNPIYNTVTTSGTTATFGAAPGASTMSLSNTAPVVFAPAASAKIIINDVMQDPSGGIGSVEYSGNAQGSAIIQVNGNNSYTDGTVFNTGATVQFTTDSNAGGTTGPFGAGSLLMNNTNNDIMQPLGGGTRTVANPITLNFGFSVANASGDTTGLTLTGPITFLATGRTITNNLASGAILTLGSVGAPSTMAMPTGSAQTSILTGSGAGVINDTIQDPNSGSSAGTISTQSSGTWTFNGPINGDGTLAVTATSNVIINGVKNGAGALRVSSTGVVTLNSQSTYSGGSTFSGGGTVINVLKSSNALPNAGFTSGPFGTGTIYFNNGTNQHLRPTGPQTLSNPISMLTGFATDTATGDSTSVLTVAGPIYENGTTGGKFISDGFATPVAGFTGTAPLILGDPSAPSTITIFGNGTLNIGAIAGPVVVNDVIQDVGGGSVGTLSLNPSAPQDSNTIQINSQNTYSGGTALGSGAAGFGTILINANAVGTPGSITSGPFGTGTINGENSNSPGVLSPMGADRTIPNQFNLTNAGFWVANSAASPFNLTLTGTITLGTAGRVITNQMVNGSALTLGSSASPTAIIDPSSLSFQTQLPVGTGGTTVINNPISGAGFLNAQVNAIVNLKGTNTYTGGTTVQTGAKLTTNTNLSNGTLTLTAGTTSFGGMATVMAQPAAGATAGVTTVPALSIDSFSKLDLTNNGLIVQSNTPFSTIQAYVLSGSANNFTGNGITSSLAAADALHSTIVNKTAVGYASVAELGNPGNFLGVPITDGNSTLVRFTLSGDSDLSGQVNSTDFSNMAAHYNQTTVGGNPVDWFDGDFNGDGTVNALDFNELAANYGLSVPASGAVPDSAAAFDAEAMAPTASLGALVPEPTTLSLVGLSLLGLRRRRVNERK